MSSRAHAHAHAHTHARTTIRGESARLRQLSSDPTNTQAIRRNFLRAMRRRFRQLRGRIREVVGYEEDRLRLRDDARLADPEDIERFPSRTGKRRAFIRWLREYLQTNVLERVRPEDVASGQHWTATYIRAAYQTGSDNAQARLQNAGIGVDQAPDPFEIGVAQDSLRRLYTRAYENLETVTADAVETVRDELTRGLAEGVNPREMARRLTKETRTIQRTQAEVLARTETINAHTQGALDRYDRAGVNGVAVSGEFATADDDRVCPICESIAGDVFDIDTMRGDSETFRFTPTDSEPDHLAGEYRIAPPCHPSCRCTILPVVG